MQHSTEALEQEIRTLEERLQQARRTLQKLQGGIAQDDGLELIELTENDIIEEPEDRLVERTAAPVRAVSDPWAGVAASALPPPAGGGDVTGTSVWPEAAPAGRDPLMTGTLAELYVSQGFVDKALGIYREILEAEPGNVIAAARLAELELQQPAGLTGTGDDGAFEASSTTVPTLPATADDGGVLAVLEGWLDNIRRLRACH